MFRTRPNPFSIVLQTLAVSLLLSMKVSSQSPPSQFCKNPLPAQLDSVLLEITRFGRGMISPTMPQLFLRVHKSGLMEYESYSGREIKIRRKMLDSSTLFKIQRLMGAADFLEARQDYPLLEDFKDGLMKTCVTYTQRGQYKHILLFNYMPSHRSAKGYYPLSLVKLLGEIEAVRPKTDYEHKYRMDKLSLQ